MATNALGQSTITTRNEAGWMAAVADAVGHAVSHTYDPFGNLTATVDALGNRTVHTYDAAGRRHTSTTDRRVQFVHDARGESWVCSGKGADSVMSRWSSSSTIPIWRCSAVAVWATAMIGCAAHPVDSGTKEAVPVLPALATPFKVSYALCDQTDYVVEASLPGNVECPGYREILQDALCPLARGVRASGTVRLAITVEQNRILDIQAVSGPVEYQEPTVEAAYRLKCFSGSRKLVKLQLDVEFRPACALPLQR